MPGCMCPDDCNCHYPWRENYCGCKAHSDAPSGDNVVEAARTFIATMPIRHSHILGREVPSGFSAASGDAAISLFDALNELDDGTEA